MTSAITIKEVTDKAGFKAFVTLPWALYKDDPNWVAPIIMERLENLDKDKNPYFEHARAKFWMAYKGNEVVGRISAQIDELVEQRHNEKIGHFGFFECTNDPAAAAALMDTACAWLKSEGRISVIGPFSLSINEESGMLVEGFDTPPSLMMNHALPYYQDLMTGCGMEKIKDLWAYYLKFNQPVLPPTIDKLVKRSMRDGKVRLRRINMKNYTRDLRIILDIFNDAWTDNWMALPFTEAELDKAVKDMKLLIREDFTYIAEYDGVPMAMMVTLPNLNEIIADLDGHLFPFGIFKLLWRLKLNPRYKTVRVPLMGVRKEFQNTALGGAMAFALIEECRIQAEKAGCTHAELSWVLEENTRLSKMLETIGCWRYKNYRMYSKTL
ncbi:MAG: N-acetyltransferase [Alphaproteobacteria bacterium]|nr:MAG: N-acetyltransferase [Alphaproteobacteria bacterium]